VAVFTFIRHRGDAQQAGRLERWLGKLLVDFSDNVQFELWRNRQMNKVPPALTLGNLRRRGVHWCYCRGTWLDQRKSDHSKAFDARRDARRDATAFATSTSVK
jgi:hypothetical protein